MNSLKKINKFTCKAKWILKVFFVLNIQVRIKWRPSTVILDI